MKIAMISDPHMANFSLDTSGTVNGINSRGQAALDCLDTCVTMSLEAGCELLVINGDLFETSSPPNALLYAVGQVLSRIPTAINLGNHDCDSLGHRDNACAMLDIIPGVTVAHTPVKVGPVWLVPFRPGDPKIWLPELLAEGKTAGAKYVSLHMGLSTDRTPQWLLTSQGAIAGSHLASLCRKNGFSHAFLGDWHEQDEYSNKSVQCHQIGTLCPHDFKDAYKSAGQMAILDTDSGQVTYQYVPGPRFFKTTPKAPFQAWLSHCVNSKATWIFAQVESPSNGMEYAREECKQALEATGIRYHLSVHPKQATISAEAKAAVQSVQSADNTLDALRIWIPTVTLPPGVTAEELSSRLVEYLK